MPRCGAVSGTEARGYGVSVVRHAGHARQLIFVYDLDSVVTQIAGRGHIPSDQENYSNGVRKATYRDPDGNEFGFGGASAPAPTA